MSPSLYAIGRKLLFVGALCAVTMPGYAADTPTATKDAVQKAYEAALANPADATALSALKAVLPTVTVSALGGGTYYILEGDLLVTAGEIERRLREHKQGTDQRKDEARKDPEKNTPERQTELKIMTDDNGVPQFWPPAQRHLTYAVARNSFTSKAEYDTVVKNIQLATADWMAVCPPCDVTYTHKADLDGKTDYSDLINTGTVTFVVSRQDAGGRFIAAAFFPNDPAYKRMLFIDPSYFEANGFNPVGVLRHELGHTLGYRHEHIDGVPGCYAEDNKWKLVTPYDSVSVMHYLCGNKGTPELKISDTDKIGHKLVYKK